jgi:DNA-binding response OmpR family regulator
VDFVIDSDARVVRCGDLQADLSPLEHDLLVSLHGAGGHIRTFAWLQEHVWHNDHQGSRSHVQSVVKRLRRKLGAIGSPVQIDGVRGVGLRLVVAGAAAPLR